MEKKFDINKGYTDCFTKRLLFKCPCNSEEDAKYTEAKLLLIARRPPYFAELYAQGKAVILDVPPHCQNVQELIDCLNEGILKIH